MQEKFLHFVFLSQQVALRLFTENDSPLRSEQNSCYTGAHCGTYIRTRTGH